MKKLDLGQTLSILANAGVIAGIVFLGLELRQNNELMAAEARRGQLSIQMETWGQVVENPDLIPLLVKDRNGEKLTVEEEFLLNSFWMRNLSAFQWAHEEQLGVDQWVLLNRSNFEAYGSLRRTWQGNSDGARSDGKDNFYPEFIDFFEQNVINR